MEVNGKVHCFFEQSGTFKNEFIKLGIPAEDYDIQNNFGQTDKVIDLFSEIEKAYGGQSIVFQSITKDDLIMDFFPCIYFECMSMMLFSWGHNNYRKLSKCEAIDKIIEREKNRTYFYTILLKFVHVCINRNFRMILENPYSEQHYLKQGNFVKNPDYVDMDRTKRGDFYKKPTAYWFFNCVPTLGFSEQQTPQEKIKSVTKSKPNKIAGMCSEERSMISSEYARNFICDQILGIEQEYYGKQLKLL